MPQPSNADIAASLERYARLLDISGDGPFRARAFGRAAAAVRSLPESVTVVANEGRLRAIPGIGGGIAATIERYSVRATSALTTS